MRLLVALMVWFLRSAAPGPRVNDKIAYARLRCSGAQLEPGPDLPIPLQAQSTRWLSGIPRAVIVFRILQPTLASTRCPCSVRLRIVRPMMVL